MAKYRIINPKQNINPNYSLTFNTHNMFTIFDEDTHKRVGYATKKQLLLIGFTKDQLRKVKKGGTTNFK